MVERVEEHWAVLKSHLLADGGYDRLVDFLGDAHNMALIERANFHTQERMRGANIHGVIDGGAASV